MENNKRYRYVFSKEDMNTIMHIADRHAPIITIKKDYKYEAGKPVLRIASYMYETDRYLRFTTMYVKDVDGKYLDISKCGNEKYVCTWIFDKSGDNKIKVAPSVVAKLVNNVYKPRDLVKECPRLFERNQDGKIVNSAKATIGYNKDYDMTEHNCVAYDLNSAYATILSKYIIDTYHMKYCTTVGKGEVGFKFDLNLTMVGQGKYADYVFPIIESPYKDFVRHWYDVKRNSPKGSVERDKAKNILTFMVGIWQNHNPFLRAFVIHSCNEIIEKIRDRFPDKVTLWNTDAVYCTEHIPELDRLVGDDIGQFKIEHECILRQKQNNYQIVDGNKVDTSYRGVSKMAFDADWNILTDRIPSVKYPYKYDKYNKEVVDNE